MDPRLFTAERNERAEEFRQYLPVNINLRYETIAPHIALAEQRYILPLLGDPLFTRLASWYADGADSSTANMTDLLDLVRFALIRLALWKGYDSIAAIIADTGVSTAVDRENRLYRYQEEQLKASFKGEGFDQLDTVLAFLETNLSDFPEFAASPFYTGNADTLVHTTAEFHTIYNIDESRLVFLRMVPFMRDVELLKLQHRIGAACYRDMLANAGKYADVLPYIKRFVVYMAVAEGIGELHKMPTEKGLIFESSRAEGVERRPVDTQQLEATRAQFAMKADCYIDAAINLMKSAPEQYQLFTAFSGGSPADGVMHFDNTNRKIFLT